MAFKRTGFPKHATVSALKEYIPQSQRQMKQYIPQTEMDWNDPRRENLDSYVTEGDATAPSEISNSLNTPVNTTSVSTTPTSSPSMPVDDFPSASSNRPMPTPIDTSDIDARWARKNARREYRQAARRDRQEERQNRRQSRRDARQQRKMDRINNRTERREARRDRRDQRKFDRQYRRNVRRQRLPSFGGGNKRAYRYL